MNDRKLKRTVNKKEETNEGEMQIASVSRKKITNKLISLETIDWYTWPQQLSSQSFWEKESLFALLPFDKKCSRLYASPKPNKFKKFIEVFAKNDHYLIETTYSKNNTPNTPILSIIAKISKFYPHS